MSPFHSTETRARCTHAVCSVLVALAAGLAGGPALAAAPVGTEPNELLQRAAPSPLLAIDRNRATVVERIVTQWSDALVRVNAGVTAEQLHEMLLGMRADQLLAASLAGSLEGLRNVIAAALVSESDVKPSLVRAKALGDANQDVVYVPVTPCRLVETRGTFPAVYQGGGAYVGSEVRTYTLQGGNGVCLTQLPGSVTPSAVQMQVYGIPTTTGSGDVEVLPQGAPFGSSASLVYLGNNAFTSSAVTTPANIANKQISVQVRGGGAHVVIDVVGYFRPPVGGYVSSVTAGTGLTGGTITSSGTIAADTTYLQRRVAGACAVGFSISSILADGSITCKADNPGTVTSVATGTGLSGGPITGTGTITADTTYLQRRVSSTCAVGSSIRVIAADGTVTCQTDTAGPNAFVQNGNAFGATAILGTTDNNALDLRVNGSRVMRYEPNAISPNVIGGSPANNVTAGVRGATIGGGGVPTAPNRVTDEYGTVGGGYGNRAGNDVGSVIDEGFATVGGGENNTASGLTSTVGGGRTNTASGAYSTVGGGRLNTASGDYSTVGGGLFNVASGEYSVADGIGSEARGDYSIALGRRAKTYVGSTNADGSIILADSNNFDFSDSFVNRFSVRATGGVRFVTDIDGAGTPTRTTAILPGGILDFGANTRQMVNLYSAIYGIGVQDFTQYARTGAHFAWFKLGVHSNTIYDPGAGGEVLMSVSSTPGVGSLVTHTGILRAAQFTVTSDRAAKHDFAEVDVQALLERVAAVPITTWAYRSDPGTRHIGVTAQDFHAAFGVGADDKSISTVDADGIALAAIQGLNAKLEVALKERDTRLVEQARTLSEERLRREDLARALEAQSVELAELKRMVEVVLARTAPGGRLAAAH